MDRIDKLNNNTDGFLKAVFPFDDEQKESLLNMIQYITLSIIPIVAVLKMIKTYTPEANDDAGSLVIFVEVVLQLTAMFLALYFIHRIVDFIPTYTGRAYDAFNSTNLIPGVLLLSLTIQSKLSDKVQILVDRLWDLYDGNSNTNHHTNVNQGNGSVRVTQPLSNQYAPSRMQGPPPPPIVQSPPPPPAEMTNMKSQSNEYSIPNTPNFDNMYSGPETPMVNAATPTMEPMAANDMGGGFGTPF